MLAASLLSGCANLKKSIEQRVSVTEQCRLATNLPPITFMRPGPLASIQLGNIGHCNLAQDNLLPICSLNQIVTKFELFPPATLKAAASDKQDRTSAGLIQQTTSSEASAKSIEKSEKQIAREASGRRLQEFHDAANNLRGKLQTFAVIIGGLDDTFKNVAETIVPTDYAKRTAYLDKWNKDVEGIGTILHEVRRSQKDLRETMLALENDLDAQAQVELAAWDSNLRFQLSRLEQVLSGDYAVVIQEGIKDQILTHVAKRTLDMMHGSLKAADVVIRQLDDKAYGAVSIGYLAFGPDIQDAVNGAFKNILISYRKRQDDKRKLDQAKAELEKGNLATSPPNESSPAKVHSNATRGLSDAEMDALTKPLMRELRRAACENLLQGTQFSILTELVDTMIILHVEPKDEIFKYQESAVSQATPAAEQPPYFNAQRINKDSPILRPSEIAPYSISDTSVYMAAASEEPLSEKRTVTPAGVHMTNAWVARQHLLTQTIAEKYKAVQAASGGMGRFPGIETVDENAVQRLADSATAKAIDDAVRLDPSMLAASPILVGPQIQNSVNVVTAATAVSHAAAIMKVNLSVSNVNTFNPTNYNSINPVINVTAPPVSSAAPSLCASGDFGRAGALCTSDEKGVVISLSHPAFQNDSCRASDLEPTLSAIGRRIADFRARYGIDHTATIEGYASVPQAQLAKCPAVARVPESACNYTNHLRAWFKVENCKSHLGDRNHALSAARARNAASVLELASQGAVTVNSLTAMGTQTAQLRGGPASADQTIVIRLQPRTPR